MPLVLVIWEDTYFQLENEGSPTEIQHETKMVYSAGWLVKANKSHTTLAYDAFPDDDLVRGTVTIPTKNIKRIHYTLITPSENAQDPQKAPQADP